MMGRLRIGCVLWAIFFAALLGGHVIAEEEYYMPPDPQEYWYTQTFDHFNTSDTRTYRERYLVYDDYYQSSNMINKPMFFCPGGEADVYGGYDHNGFMFQYGQTVGAFLLFPEHRFYGQSLPFGPVDSYTADNLEKLTIEQALEDYIAVIGYVIERWNLPNDIPIIAYGGSYPGELAAFLRIAYPNVIDGSLASSAPVRYHPFLEGGTKSGAFYAVATRDFAQQDQRCPDLVRMAFTELIDSFSTSDGLDNVEKQLQLCSPLQNSSLELRDVNLWIENAFASLGMENYPYQVGDLPPSPMKYACQVMYEDSQHNDVLHSLGQAIGVWYNASGTLTCFNISDEYYPCADITGCGGGVGDPDAMSWDYQSCTEIVANVDTNNVTDMFPPAPYNFDNLVEYCQTKWGVTPDPLKIPTMYNYTTSSRIIFSNGFLDPWWPGGVLTSIEGSDIIALQMRGAAHHLDLRGSDPNDPDDVTQTRVQEAQIINTWLADIAGTKKPMQFRNRPQW